MKNTIFKNSLLLILLFFGLFSCKDADVNQKPIIQSIAITKTSDVVFSEQVSVIGNTKDDDQLTYTWECTGGTFIGQGYTVTWVAPNQAGTYIITLTVSDGKETTSSQREIEVVGFYTFDFSQSSSLWGKSSNMSINISVNGIATLVNTSSITASLGYALTDSIPIPYSIKTRVAVNYDDFSAGSTARSSCYFWFANPNTGGDYLASLVFHIRAGLRSWEVKAGIYDAESDQVIYQALEANASGTDKIIFSQNNEFHIIGMAITSDKTLIINIDGQELYQSTILSDLNLYPGELKLRKFSYYIDPTVSCLVDNFYITNDGTVLK